jgi:hypothetical protein
LEAKQLLDGGENDIHEDFNHEIAKFFGPEEIDFNPWP